MYRILNMLLDFKLRNNILYVEAFVPRILLKLNDDDFERNISAADLYKNDFVGI